jgi:hypothetical protein
VVLKDFQPQHQHNNDLHWINKHDQLPKQKLRRTHERKLRDLIKERQRTYNNNINLQGQ